MKLREDNNENDIYQKKKKNLNHFDQQRVSKFISRLGHKRLLKPLLELSNLVLNKVYPDRIQNIFFNFLKGFPVRMKIAQVAYCFSTHKKPWSDCLFILNLFSIDRQTDRPDRGEHGWNLKVEDWHDVMVKVSKYNYQYCARSSGNRFSPVGKVLEANGSIHLGMIFISIFPLFLVYLICRKKREIRHKSAHCKQRKKFEINRCIVKYHNFFPSFFIECCQYACKCMLLI